MKKLLKLNYDADFYYDKAADLAEKGRSGDAIYYFFRALSLEPFNPWIMVEIGHCYFDLGVVRIALEWYRRALAYEKDCDEANQGAANCLIALGRTDIALDYIGRIEEMDPDELVGDLEMAATDLQEQNKPATFALLSDVRNAENLNRAKLGLLTGDIAAAESYLKKVKEDSDEFCEAAYFLALIYCDSGRLDEALALSEKMLKLFPNDGKTYVVRMAVCEKTNMDQQRQEVIQAIKGLKPDNYIDALGIAICCSDLGLYDVAAEFYEHCIEFQPYDKNSLISLALCYHNVGRRDECKETLIKVSRLFPEDAVGKYYLRCTYENKNDIINPLEAQTKTVPSDCFQELTDDIKRLSVIEFEDKYDADDEYYDKVAALFASDRYDILHSFVIAVAPSERFRPLFRQLLIRQETPFKLKCECLTWLLFFEKNKQFALLEDGKMKYFRPTDIKKVSAMAKIVFWKTYAALELLSVDFSEKSLKDRQKAMLEKDEHLFDDVALINENAACLASLICGDKPFTELKQFCDLFDADIDKCTEVAKKWEDLRKND